MPQGSPHALGNGGGGYGIRCEPSPGLPLTLSEGEPDNGSESQSPQSVSAQKDLACRHVGLHSSLVPLVGKSSTSYHPSVRRMARQCGKHMRAPDEPHLRPCRVALP